MNSKNDPPAPEKSSAGGMVHRIDQVGYQELLEEALGGQSGAATPGEKLSTSGTAESPTLERGQVPRNNRIKLMALVLTGLIVINLLMVGYFSMVAKPGLDQAAADKELQQVYGPDYDVLAAWNELNNPRVPYSGTNDPDFLAVLGHLNEALQTLDGAGDPSKPLKAEDFRINGNEIIYIEGL